jgi:hypothetical protein
MLFEQRVLCSRVENLRGKKMEISAALKFTTTPIVIEPKCSVAVQIQLHPHIMLTRPSGAFAHYAVLLIF